MSKFIITHSYFGNTIIGILALDLDEARLVYEDLFYTYSSLNTNTFNPPQPHNVTFTKVG